MAYRGSQENMLGRRLIAARERARSVATSEHFDAFVETVRTESPWRFNGVKGLERYLRGVDHHLRHFVPALLACVDGEIRTVFDFGCGSGSASIAMALVYPEIRCCGTDINPKEVAVARARAALYGVGDRCRFDHVGEGQALPAPDNQFDLCMCCSVLEYVTATDARRFCVQEMARVTVPGGMLFMSVPNRLYPVEIHSRKLGWNWFPKLLKARIAGSDAWQVRSLAHPHVLRLYRTSWLQLLMPWTNFCLRKTG